MPCFICEKCGCVDNTACGGNYWIHTFNVNTNQKTDEKIMCCECYTGKWHGMFPKKSWSDYGTPEELIESERKHPGGLLNLEEFLKSIGKFPKSDLHT